MDPIPGSGTLPSSSGGSWFSIEGIEQGYDLIRKEHGECIQDSARGSIFSARKVFHDASILNDYLGDGTSHAQYVPQSSN